MSKHFLSEREGQIKFFEDLKISADIELTNNTDGVYKGTLFEFKLTISNINRVLFQAIKYLSHMRIKGEPVPAQIVLVALNEENAYLFNSSDFLPDIEKIYAGAASKNNADFSTNAQPEKINFSSMAGLQRVIEVLNVQNYTKVHIDVFDVVGWANRYYSQKPEASKSALFDELRAPSEFKDFILPWEGKDTDFKYINDLLNAKSLKKELGAFYTPSPYCHKATELVRRAIKRLPIGHDYIILDRSAGTGNLEEFLTDRPVNDILLSDLHKYIDSDLKSEYLKDKANVITTFYSGRFNDITIGELERYKTNISLHSYLSDNEIGHAIVNTYELKEWIVLNERMGDKVKLIIPPKIDPANALVNGGDALSDHFVLGSGAEKMFADNEYYTIIDELNGYVSDEKTNIILLENPPFSDSSADNTDQGSRKGSRGFIYEQFKKAAPNNASHRDLSNLFIWSGWQYYMKKPDDYYVLFSPIKYWKSLKLSNRDFIDGFLFNRKFFHAGPSSISCILWQNIADSREEMTLKAYDIDTKGSVDTSDDRSYFIKNVNIKKVHKNFTEYQDKRVFNDDSIGICCNPDGKETDKDLKNKVPLYNKNIIGYMFVKAFPVDPKHYGLYRVIELQPLTQSYGFYLRADNFIEKLPLFAAKLYPQKQWYERDVYFTTADGGNRYMDDDTFLKACLILICLTQRNHCRSFNGSDGRYYRNELCFESGTQARDKLSTFQLTSAEKDLLDIYYTILEKAKFTKNYNAAYSYGPYQIDQELNTRFKNDTDEVVYDYPELNTSINALKIKLTKYYEEAIQPKLFEYELLK